MDSLPEMEKTNLYPSGSLTDRLPHHPLAFEKTLNLNTERTQKLLDTQVVRKDYFK